MNEGVKEQTSRNLLDEIASWSQRRKTAFGIVAVPLIAFYVSVTPLALGWGKVGEYINLTGILMIVGTVSLGHACHLRWPNSLIPKVLPTIALALVFWIFLALAKPVNEWYLGLPFLFEVVGTPMLSNYLFHLYETRVGLKAAT